MFQPEFSKNTKTVTRGVCNNFYESHWKGLNIMIDMDGKSKGIVVEDGFFYQFSLIPLFDIIHDFHFGT